MVFSDHLRLLGVATVGWIIFVVLGWPWYFQHWGPASLIKLCIAVYYTLGLTLYWLINRCKGSLYIRGFWVGFYATVPLILYDYLYIYNVLGNQFELLNRFWYLSCFYVIPWIQIVFLILYIKTDEDKAWLNLFTGIFLIFVSMILKNMWATFEGNFFDWMSDYPERNITMLESALKYASFGTFMSAGVIFIMRSVKFLTKRDEGGR